MPGSSIASDCKKSPAPGNSGSRSGSCHAKLPDMFVRRYGQSGPLVVVLHGGPGAVGDAAPIAQGLSENFRVVEPWQRGSGSAPLTVARHVADLHELVTELGGDAPPAIVGHSWGAMLALCYAAEYPREAGPIILVGCGTFDQAARNQMQATIEGRMDDDLRGKLRRMAIEPSDPADRFMRTFRLTRHLFDFDPVGPYPGKEESEPFDVLAHDETWRDMARLQAVGLYPGAFAAIESPVLMLHGAYDPHPGSTIRDTLIQYLPQLEYHEWERCGHSPWIEKYAREEFFSAIREWLATKVS